MPLKKHSLSVHAVELLIGPAKVKSFCLKCKYIFFFKENPVFLDQQEHLRPFLAAGDI
jgi:hypothetical protein